MSIISRLELNTILFKDLPSWTVKDDMICKTYDFSSFAEAIVFVNKVAVKSGQLEHYPDIDIRSHTVHVCLMTDAIGGVTREDIELAVKIENLAR